MPGVHSLNQPYQGLRPSRLVSLDIEIFLLYRVSMGDNIRLLVHRLLGGPKLAAGSPETIENIDSKGHPITQFPEISLEEAIDKLFDNRKQVALQIAGRLRSCPTWDVQILYLYDEIRQCILFGINGTAIILCAILVEFILKYAIFSKRQKDNVNFNSEAWKEFKGKMTLRPAIEAAKKGRLITDEMAGSLHSFANDIRDTYSHFNIQAITKDFYFKDVSVLNAETGQDEVRDIPADFTPGFQILAKSTLDEQTVWKVFQFSDTVVQHLLSHIKETA